MNNLKPHKSIDPAVEEVLASIRQIMAIDTEDAEADAGNDVISFPKSRQSSSRKASVEKSDILTLTEVIGTDGSVTSLSEREAEMAAKQENEKAKAAAKQDVTEEPAEESQQDTTLDLSDEQAATEESADNSDHNAETSNEAVTPSDRLADISMISADDIESLMSPEAVAQSTEAFGDLNKITGDVKQRIQKGTFGNQTVDELMREMLRPLLKEWLDSHLPSLVKWLVAEKIEQMIREKQGETKKTG